MSLRSWDSSGVRLGRNASTMNNSMGIIRTAEMRIPDASWSPARMGRRGSERLICALITR